MKSFFEWFKASTKVKRWILLIIFGIVLTCYGISKILVSEEITFFELGKTVIIFIIGFIAIIVGIVYIQKRSLEIIIEANSPVTDKGEKAKHNIKSLIFNKRVFEEGPKVVIIGGGRGLNTVIEGFKKYTNNITAIVTMTDYGNIPTESRKALDSLPLKDIKDSIIAMSDKEEIMKKLMYLNFQNERLKGLNFGDIYLTAMNEIYNNISEAILKSTAVLNITGKVIPVTLDEITICAELNDGTTIKQKEQIPGIVAKKFEKINRIYISPSNCRPAPGVIEAIEDSDVIIMGPGSLYTNVLPNLLVKNVSKAIKDSKAMRFYISNIMTEPGQTDNYTLSDHFKAINEHVGTDIIDYCLADTGEIVPEYIRKYNKEGSEPVEIDDKNLSAYNIKVIERNLSCIKNEKIRHNSDVIAGTIIEMICNDLKFHDMQNNTEYLLLQSVLKDYKKNLDKNIKRSKKKKTSKDNIKMTSKFKEKYNDRVKSIQNTENKISENRRIASEIEKMEKEKMNSYTEYNYESSRRASGLKERRSHGRRNK